MNKDFTIIPGTGAAIYWPDIDPDFKFVTVDFYGNVEAYINKPRTMISSGFWTVEADSDLNLFALKGNFENWQELIFERPE